MVAFLNSATNQISTGAGARKSDGLGNTRANCRTRKKAFENQQLRIIEKEQFRRLQREITTSESLKRCGIAPIPDREEIPIIFRKTHASWSGVQTCKNKMCLRCHIKKRMEHIDQADRALYEVEKKGGSILMMTLTCSNDGVDLKPQSEGLQSAFRSVFKRRKLKRLMEEKGYIGTIRSQEVQINTSRFTFHPHLHLAVAFEHAVDDEQLEEISSMVRMYWCESMKKQGLYALRSQQHITRAKSDSGKYVAKGAAQEIANSTIKRGSQGSVSWVGLLFEIWEAGQAGNTKRRDHLVNLYRHMEISLRSKQLISISGALKELIPDEVEEEEPQEKEEEASEVLMVPLKIYNKLCQMKVSHLVPSFLMLDSGLKSRFSSLCDTQRLVDDSDPRNFTCDLFVQQQLEEILKPWARQSVWAQNRSLGVYETKRVKPP